MAMACQPEVTCVADVRAVLGEGPVWVPAESALYWVDIKGRKIFRYCDGQLADWDTPVRVGSLVPRELGGFVAGTDEGLALVDPETGVFDVFVNPESGKPDNRFNDGKVDRVGRFWAGTMDDTMRSASGVLYCMDTDLSVTAIDRDYAVCNGPAFSPDGRIMYHNDSGRRVTYAFDVDEGGNATNRREFARFGEGEGYPDGMTVDAEGCLWIAFWDGWCLRRLSPGGERLAQLDLPVQRPTSCAFGRKELATLFITSASEGLKGTELDAQPLAGGLFAAEVGVKGIAEVPFAG